MKTYTYSELQEVGVTWKEFTIIEWYSKKSEALKAYKDSCLNYPQSNFRVVPVELKQSIFDTIST